jgi:hypothetical protein
VRLRMSAMGQQRTFRHSISPSARASSDGGAAATTAMTHIAIAEALDGKVVEWMEKVSDEQYAQ